MPCVVLLQGINCQGGGLQHHSEQYVAWVAAQPEFLGECKYSSSSDSRSSSSWWGQRIVSCWRVSAIAAAAVAATVAAVGAGTYPRVITATA